MQLQILHLQRSIDLKLDELMDRNSEKIQQFDGIEKPNDSNSINAQNLIFNKVFSKILKSELQPLTFEELFIQVEKKYPQIFPTQVVHVKPYCKRKLSIAVESGIIRAFQDSKTNKMLYIAEGV